MAYRLKNGTLPTSGKGSKPSAKMQMFVSEYMVDMNATDAYKRAGYKSKNARIQAVMLMQHPWVSSEIKRLMDKKRERNEITADYLIQKLVAIIEATEADNPQAALRGIELAGKSIALWKERQEISGPDGGAIQHEQKVKQSADEFTRRIAGLAERGGESEVVEFPKRRGEG